MPIKRLAFVELSTGIKKMIFWRWKATSNLLQIDLSSVSLIVCKVRARLKPTINTSPSAIYILIDGISSFTCARFCLHQSPIAGFYIRCRICRFRITCSSPLNCGIKHWNWRKRSHGRMSATWMQQRRRRFVHLQRKWLFTVFSVTSYAQHAVNNQIYSFILVCARVQDNGPSIYL